MFSLYLIAFPLILLAAGAVTASRAPKPVCEEFLIPVNITAPYYNLDLSIETNWDAVDYIFNSTRRDSTNAFIPIVGNYTGTNTYTIGATFCRPSAGGSFSETVLVLTHGSMVDRSYWNPTFAGSENYNFVQHVIDEGYSVFFYDRLGTGRSSKPDPVSKVQFAPQVEILASLTRLLQLPRSHYTSGTTIRRVVQVGHSFGSFISLSLLATQQQSGLGDAIVLTGFSGLFDWLGLWTSGAQARAAALQFPNKWPRLPHGYLVPTDVYALAYGGFKSPFFDREVVQAVWDNQAPYAIGESLTAGTWPLDFSLIKVPVQVVQGRYDLTACGGLCDGLLDKTSALFSGSARVEVNGSFNGGHLLNYHYDGKKAFDAITAFLKAL